MTVYNAVPVLFLYTHPTHNHSHGYISVHNDVLKDEKLVNFSATRPKPVYAFPNIIIIF